MRLSETIPLPVRHKINVLTIFLSRKAAIQVCILIAIENKPPVNQSNPILIARHSDPNTGTPIT